MAGHSVEEIDAAGDVGSVESAGFANGFGDQSFAREVHDGVNGVFGKDFFDLRADAEIGFAEECFGRDGGGVAFLKIVEGDHLVAARQENFCADAADVACCSGYENVQGSGLAFIGGICSAFALESKLTGWEIVVSREFGKYGESATGDETRKNSRGRHAALESQKDQVGAAAHAEFAEEVGDVKLYGALGDVEFAGDFLVGKIFEERVQNFLLAAAEICDGIGFETASLTRENRIHEAGKDRTRNPESAVGDEGQGADQLIARFRVSEKTFNTEAQ